MYAMSTSMENASLDGAAERSKTHEPTMIRRPLDHCPACGNGRFLPIVDLDEELVHFLCASCSRCWRVELGYVQRVPPATCDGCPQREQCTHVYLLDHASADAH
jgi:hypothetical protein